MTKRFNFEKKKTVLCGSYRAGDWVGCPDSLFFFLDRLRKKREGRKLTKIVYKGEHVVIRRGYVHTENLFVHFTKYGLSQQNDYNIWRLKKMLDWSNK